MRRSGRITTSTKESAVELPQHPGRTRSLRGWIVDEAVNGAAGRKISVGKRRRWVAAAVGALAVGCGAIAASAASPGVTASVTSTGDLVDGDQVAVELSGVTDDDRVFLTQCVITDDLRDGVACGRPASTIPGADGQASLLLTVRAAIGGDPAAACPPVDGRCVLRVTQGGFASERATGISPTLGGDQPAPPPDGNKLVQDIGVTVRDPDDPSPPTSAPGSPFAPAPQGGGVTVPQPSFPTTPVDAPRGRSTSGDQSRPPSAEVPGEALQREAMPETGSTLTAILAAAGLALLVAGWLPASALRRAQLVTGGSVPVKD
jgi:hypothetical protein